MTWPVLVKVLLAASAAQIILATGGKAALARGGFTGSDPAMAVTKFQKYVSASRVVLLQLEDDPGGVRLRLLAAGRALRGAVGEPRGERDGVLAGRGVRVHDAHGACSVVELNRLF